MHLHPVHPVFALMNKFANAYTHHTHTHKHPPVDACAPHFARVRIDERTHFAHSSQHCDSVLVWINAGRTLTVQLRSTCVNDQVSVWPHACTPMRTEHIIWYHIICYGRLMSFARLGAHARHATHTHKQTRGRPFNARSARSCVCVCNIQFRSIEHACEGLGACTLSRACVRSAALGRKTSAI